MGVWTNSRRLCILFFVLTSALWSQDPPLAIQGRDVIIHVSTTLVQVDALVTDSNGRHIADLTPADFTISEDGKPQRITNFSYVTGPARGSKAAATGTGTPDSGVSPGASGALAEPKLGRDAAGRVIAIVVDDLHTSALNLARIRTDLRKLAESQIGPNDLVSMSNVSSGNVSGGDFTHDQTALHEAADRATSGTGPATQMNTIQTNECPPLVTRFDATMDKVSRAIRSMRELPGRKAVILLNDGIAIPPHQTACGLEGDRMRSDMSKLVDQAVRAGVTLYVQDTHGLSTDTLDASHNSAAPAGTVLPGGPGDAMAIYVRQSNSQQGLQAATQKLRNADVAAREVSEYLTSQTGGFFAYGHNDLLEAIDKSLDDMSGYYLIGFQPPSGDFELKNGNVQWHKIEIQLRSGRGLLVRSTRGFAGTPGGYATDGVSTGPADEVKQEIDEAFLSSEQRNDLPVRLRAEFFKDGDNATVTATVRIDAVKLPYRREAGRNRDDITLVIGLFDQNGNFVSAFQKVIEVRLKDETLDAWMQSGIVNKTDFSVKPGKYLLRLVVRDAVGQSMAEQSTGVEIPW